MKRYSLIILLLSLVHGSSFSQEGICIGEKYKMYSGYLQEERGYQVYLPTSYHEKSDVHKKYPVIYLIDGESLFHSLTAIQELFTKGRMFRMPECIIVGIISTNRTRDLTPTKSAYRRDGTVREGDKEMGGECDVFADFLTKELRSVIDSVFYTSGKNILFGHSYGGLFTLNTFLNETLPAAQRNGLKYYSKIFPDENHGSIPIPGMIDAFKQVYMNFGK